MINSLRLRVLTAINQNSLTRVFADKTHLILSYTLGEKCHLMVLSSRSSDSFDICRSYLVIETAKCRNSKGNIGHP